jgi:transposase-like protein
VHIALGDRADGTKEILAFWLEQNDGTKFWLRRRSWQPARRRARPLSRRC